MGKGTGKSYDYQLSILTEFPGHGTGQENPGGAWHPVRAEDNPDLRV